jgi:arylsulfatase A-like enzyme
VPLLVRWPKQVKPGISETPVSQVDFLADFATLLGQSYNHADAPDSENQLNALLGRDPVGRSVIVEHAGTLSIVQGNAGEGRWKYIEPSQGAARSNETNTELGNNPKPQLYNLTSDVGEKQNVADQHPDRVRQMQQLLDRIRNKETQ